MNRMKWFVVPAFLVLPLAFLAANGGGGEPCPVREKVAGLLSSWKAAAEEARALSVEAREEIHARLAGLARECPVGSRMGGTLAAVRDVLGVVIAAEKAHAGSCPLSSGAKEGAGSEARAAALKLKETRAAILRDLQQLASYAAGDDASAACCAEALKGAAAGKPGAACCPGCAAKLPARVAELEASWEKAGQESRALPAAKRQEISAGFGEIVKKSKAAALIVPSALALTEGFDSLEAIHGKMDEWARANPQLLAAVDEDARKCFECGTTLIHDASSALHRMRDVIQDAGACGKQDGAGGEASPAPETAVKN